jgi:hypothetical protein
VKSGLLLLLAIPAWAQLCAPPATLLPNDSQVAGIDDNSCRMADGTSYVSYALTVPTRGTMQVTLKGAAGFAPALILRDVNRHLVVSGASINRYIEAGTYSLLVNAAIPNQSGNFTLTSIFAPEAYTLCKIFPSIGTGQKISRQLAASSCKLPDRSAFDAYHMTVFGSGTLTLTMSSPDFSSYVILRGDNGSALSAADAGGKGNPATISLAVDGNATYTIVAAASSASEKPGHYDLSTDFVPNANETCIAQGYWTESAEWTGSVGTNSCGFNLPGRLDSSLFNFYNLHVTQSGSVQITVRDSTFSPLLLILDANGNQVAEDAQAGGYFTPLLLQQLSPGDYKVLIFNEESFEGQYTIDYSFTPGANQPCPTITLNDGTSTNGTLDGQTNCRVMTFLADTYQISMPVAGTLNVNLSSGDFTSLLFLEDAKGNELDFGEETTDNGSAHVQVSLPGGTYYVVAASVDLPGSYTFHYAVTNAAIPPCPPAKSMAINSGVAGRLGSPASCTAKSGALVDNYTFTTTAPGAVAFSMTSPEVDSRLSLSDAKGNALRSDSDGYNQGNAIIVQFLQAGVYKVTAGAEGFLNTGSYRVDLKFAGLSTAPQTCAAKALALNTPLKGTSSFTSCQYFDHTFADLYQVKVANGSTPLDISLVSTQFDAYLILLDGKGNMIAADDNSGGGTNARILQNVTPGTYYVVAKPASDPSTTGSYSLTVK